MMRPARTAASSVVNGLKPAAMRSAFTKIGHSASPGKNSCANVVLPAPFGPAMIKILRSLIKPKHLRIHDSDRTDSGRTETSYRPSFFNSSPQDTVVCPLFSMNVDIHADFIDSDQLIAVSSRRP